MERELSHIIQEEISKKGPISFRDFMEMALYYPEMGYYTSGKQRIGRSGDYYTSPHVSKVFGELITIQLEEMWEILGREDFTVVEMGAGKGLLAADIQSYIKDKEPEFYQKLSYVTVERDDDLPQVEKGCFLSNELVDAFPVHRIVVREGSRPKGLLGDFDGAKISLKNNNRLHHKISSPLQATSKGNERRPALEEIFVDVQDDRFVEMRRGPSTAKLENYFQELGVTLPPGFVTEVNLEATRWIRDVGRHLKKGFVITIDYGYPSKELYQTYRAKGTLLCYYKHTVNDKPYQHIGEQDITSHVNFSALIHWGEEAGLKTTGFTDQAHFLINLGLIDRMQELQRKTRNYQDYLKRYLLLKNLIAPGGMGETFKVLIQHKAIEKLHLTGLGSDPNL
jgi:SAM-dependent MidA family methyltransferase